MATPGNGQQPDGGCNNTQDEFEYLTSIAIQTLVLLTLSHIFHLGLKRFGQPTAISQILAGVVLGRSGLAGIPDFAANVFPGTSMDYLSSTATIGRMLFMFLVGLEMDIPCLLRIGRPATIVACGGALACLLVGGVSSPLVYWQTKADGNRILFAFTLMLVFTNSASPVLVRIANELKLSTSDFGRLAVSAAIINDIACLLLVAIFTSSPGTELSAGREVGMGACTIAILGAAAYLSPPVVRWLNRRNRQRKHIKNTEVVSLLLFIVGVTSITEMMGYNSMIGSFLLGLVFPREGSTTRTLIRKLSYPVNNLLVPVYIGYAGTQANVRVMHNARFVGAVFTIVSLSTAAKVGGTVLSSKYLGMPLHEGVVLGFLLNVKGHVDIIILGLARNHRIWGADAFMVLLVTIVMNTLMVGPVVSVLVSRERKELKHKNLGLEWQPPENELRVLACVHSPRDSPAVLNLLEISNGTDQTPLSAYLMHLIELSQKTVTAMLYHQQEEIEDGEDDDYGGEHARQINVTVDAFMVETKIRIRQVTAVSSFMNMHEEICHRAEDVWASIIILPFHKFQRVDGKMVTGKDGIRETNVKVLRHATCTIGILVDRGLSGITQIAAAQASYQVVALFFGGPDDREAVAYGSRLTIHQGVKLTVMRFLPTSRKENEDGITIQASKDEEVRMSIMKHESEGDKDDAFLSNFYNRFVVSGVVTYEEKFVENGAETVAAIAAIEGTYSLFLVGRGWQGMSPLTKGLMDREECPELGAVGDLLASSSSKVTASVLVVQQHSKPQQDNDADRPFTAS